MKLTDISIWGYPVYEVVKTAGLEDIQITISFERDAIATKKTIPYRVPTVDECRALIKKYRRRAKYQRRYARGKTK